MTVEWTDDADLEAVEDYFGQYNLRSAVAAGDRIVEQVDLLEKFPEMGHNGKFAGTREIVVPQSACVVVYRRELYAVRILRIIHGGQKWPKNL